MTNAYRNTQSLAQEQTMAWLGFIPIRTGLTLVQYSVLIDCITSVLLILFFFIYAFEFRGAEWLMALGAPYFLVLYLNL